MCERNKCERGMCERGMCFKVKINEMNICVTNYFVRENVQGNKKVEARIAEVGELHYQFQKKDRLTK